MNKFDNVCNMLESVKPGCYKTYCYATEVPVNASSKKAGISIRKITKAVARTGINYGHLASVIEKDKNKENGVLGIFAKKSNFIAVANKKLKNKLVFNTKTNKYYVNLFPMWNQVSSTYELTINGKTTNVSKEDIRGYVRPSYFNSGDAPEMIRVSAENFICD